MLYIKSIVSGKHFPADEMIKLKYGGYIHGSEAIDYAVQDLDGDWIEKAAAYEIYGTHYYIHEKDIEEEKIFEYEDRKIYFVIDEETNTAIPIDEAIFVEERGFYRKERIGYNIYRCPICGNYYLDDDGRWVEGEFICEGCFQSAWDNGEIGRCEDCGELIWEENAVIINDRYVCEDCASNYTRCTNCGDYVWDEDVVWINDEPYCEYCAGEIEERGGRVIIPLEEARNDASYIGGFWILDRDIDRLDDCLLDYCAKPEYIWHGNQQDKMWFGLEIEVEKKEEEYMTDHVYNIVKIARETIKGDCYDWMKWLYLKYDSSIDGAEIVTHPMSFRCWKTNRKGWMEFIEKLKEKVTVSTRTGIHIHFSWKPEMTNEEIENIVRTVRNSYTGLLALGRRVKNEYCYTIKNHYIYRKRYPHHSALTVGQDGLELRTFQTYIDYKYIDGIVELTKTLVDLRHQISNIIDIYKYAVKNRMKSLIYLFKTKEQNKYLETGIPDLNWYMNNEADLIEMIEERKRDQELRIDNQYEENTYEDSLESVLQRLIYTTNP